MSITKVSNSMLESGPISVRDFGAIGDGVTDDSLAIQAALDYAVTQECIPSTRTGGYYAGGGQHTESVTNGLGREVIIEGGSFNLGSVNSISIPERCLLVIRGAELISNISNQIQLEYEFSGIECAMNGRIVYMGTDGYCIGVGTAANPLSTMYAVKDIYFNGLTFFHYGIGTTNPYYAVKAAGTYNIRFNNVFIIGPFNASSYGSPAHKASGIHLGQANIVGLIDIRDITNCYEGIRLEGDGITDSQANNAIKICNGGLRYNSKSLIAKGQRFDADLTIQNVTIEQNNTSGIDLTGSLRHIVIEKCYFENNGPDGGKRADVNVGVEPTDAIWSFNFKFNHGTRGGRDYTSGAYVNLYRCERGYIGHNEIGMGDPDASAIDFVSGNDVRSVFIEDLRVDGSGGNNSITGYPSSLCYYQDFFNVSSLTFPYNDDAYRKFALTSTEYVLLETIGAEDNKDYIGTWTPTITFGGGSSGVTYSVQSGTYERVGSIVKVGFTIRLTSKGSDTGDAAISGLPFAAFGGKDQSNAIFFQNMASMNSLIIGINSGVGETISLRQVSGTTTVTPLTDTNFTSISHIEGSFIYSVDPTS